MQSSWKKSWIMALALSLLLVLAGLSATQSGDAKGANRPEDSTAIDSLDRIIQKRFHEVIGFGMTRVGTERKFLPDTSEEKAVVKELKRTGYRVTLFLAGRNILQDIPDRFRYNRRLFGSAEDHMLSGPVTVGHDDLKGLPDARALWEPAREALRQFDKGESRYAFTENGWRIDARPVRAFAEECVKCHGRTSIQVTPDNTITIIRSGDDNGLRVGDPVGAMLYVYKRKK
jgi:hypothetical protein